LLRKQTIWETEGVWNDNIQMGLHEIECGLGLSGSGYGTVAGCHEHTNETSGSIEDREFLDYLSNC
jgi:hypothetical protein